jgi:hypothetical protein
VLARTVLRIERKIDDVGPVFGRRRAADPRDVVELDHLSVALEERLLHEQLAQDASKSDEDDALQPQ